MRDLWVVYLDIKHSFDPRVLFNFYPDIDILIGYDLRGKIPQAVIQFRRDLDLQDLALNIYDVLNQLEPSAWHYELRSTPNNSGTLINGGRNRFNPQGSLILSNPEEILSVLADCY